MRDLATGEPKFAGHETVHPGALDHASSQLVLLAGSESEAIALVVEGHHVVVATNDVGNVLEARDLDQRGLDRAFRRESKDAFVALYRSLLTFQIDRM